MLTDHSYNPDVLSCIANLSSDEVFTPPELVNQMLDLLPQELFRDKSSTFLDPACKSGVFLREIAKRLDIGLEAQIPDRQKRIDHIFTKQLYGLAITELTSLLSRRSLYCSKHANGKYSVCTKFKNESGYIHYTRIEHTWQNGRCIYCGANEQGYDRGEELESHAYSFIHTENPEDLFKMKFDVIIGNPPYQMSDGGDSSQGVRTRGGATPIYDLFVRQAKKLSPRYLIMIIPSRWFSGGRGLDTFRDEMINDDRIRNLVDFPVSSECFPGVEIKGGVCYFLWCRDEHGSCEVKTLYNGKISKLSRSLKEEGADIFIRFNGAVTIYRKVCKDVETKFSSLVSTQRPFGFRTYHVGEKEQKKGAVVLFGNKSISYIQRSEITQNTNWVDCHKVMISMAYGAGESFPHQIINVPFYAEPNSCCTETYLVIGPFRSKSVCKSVMSYMATKFFRFMVLLRKSTQHAAQGVYSFVPIQDFSQPWTDEKLYKKYNLSQEEIDFIESMIRPMELADA